MAYPGGNWGFKPSPLGRFFIDGVICIYPLTFIDTNFRQILKFYICKLSNDLNKFLEKL